MRILVDTSIRPGNLCIGRISQWRMRGPQVFTSGDRHFGANTTSSWVRHWQFPWLSNRSHASNQKDKLAHIAGTTRTKTLLFLILDHLTFWLMFFSRSLSASPLSKNMRIFPWLTTEAAPWKPQDAPQHIHLQPSSEAGLHNPELDWGMYLYLFHPTSYILPPIWPLGPPRHYEDIPKACLQLKDSEALQTAEVNQFFPC